MKQDKPQTERIKTHDYCDICNHKGCKNCIANNLDDYCVPSGYAPTTQTETQNSNLTFEKADEPQTEPLQTCSVNGRPYSDCCNCEYFRCTADEPQTKVIMPYERMRGLYTGYRKTEPQTDCPWK